MSRSISIGYQLEKGGELTDIEIQPPYDLFGTQGHSTKFWSLPVWSNIGVSRLAVLGHSDPIYFIGWDDMQELATEIQLIQRHWDQIEFFPLGKSQYIAHLVYCYHLLVDSAPEDSIPQLDIG